MIAFVYLRTLLKNIFNSMTSLYNESFKDFEKYFRHTILRNFRTSQNIFYLPTFLLKYSEQEFS